MRLEQARSLGFRTDVAILTANGSRVTEHDGYLRIETPDNPGFFWGNYLYFARSPRSGDLERWEEKFRHEFRLSPGVQHRVFSWDTEEPGDTDQFVGAGYTLDTATVLALESGGLAEPAAGVPGLEVRPLSGDEEWEAMIRNQIACRLDGFSLAEYEPFKRRQAAGWRRLAEQGHGDWYGSFLGGRLVAECGLYFFGGLGRFQAVGTAPEFRRRGICAAMIRSICDRAFARHPRATLVMVAASEEPAERIYRRVGFLPRETSYGLCKQPAPLTI